MKQGEKRRNEISNLFKVRDLLTAIVLVASLFITYKLWTSAIAAEEKSEHTGFYFRVRESNDRIQQRLAVYEQVLHATVGLFHASKTVTRNQFHAFIDALGLTESYPGIEAVGLSLVIPAGELETHIASMRREGFPDYSVWPAGQRDVHTSIVYIEPFAGRNLRAFGYDMYSNPIRRAAMEQARDTGKASVTGRVTLVQESDSTAQAGFLMYLPVYRTATPPGTVEERRANLVGWIYAPFRMDDFMRGTSGKLAEDIDIEIYDGATVDEAAKMFDATLELKATAPDRKLRRIDRIVAGNRTWTIATTAMPAFEQQITSDRPRLILHAGISISLMISLLIWVFLDDRARALQAANQAMQLALYDALTGLPNRKLLDERLAQAIAHAKRTRRHAALLFIDLDKFKPVNDTYGHAYGDLLLKEVAQRLLANMRRSDTASRLGGDEFVVLLLDVEGPQDVMVVATKILHHLTDPYEISGHTFDISASIGAAIYPDHGADNKSLMKSADLAMYDAKNSGRANVKLAQPLEPA